MSAARSRRPPNGWSTTTIWSNGRSAKSAPLCRPAIIGSCRSWPTARSPDIPRVFGLAWAFVAHTDSHFDPEMLCRFVSAYQEVQPLTIGELWAVAITLRIVLVENLRRIAERIIAQQRRRGRRPTASPTACWVPADAHRSRSRLCSRGVSGKPLPDAFAVQLVHRLRDQDPRVTPALTWLDEHLAAQESTADAVVRDEHQRQGAGTVTVRNIITSMRLISDVDWPELFERVSLVDDVLGATGSFRDMDFPTRNLYRSAIEELARGADRTELDVARAAVLAAKQAARTHDTVEDDRRGDPGYHLLAGGRPAFEATDRLPAAAEHAGRNGSCRAVRHRRLCRRRGRGRRVLLAIPLFILHATGARPGLAEPAWRPGAIPAIDVGGRPGQSRPSPAASARRSLPALELRGGVPAASAHPRRGADAADDAASDRANRSSVWRSTIWRARTAICISRCSPTGWMPRPSRSTATRRCWTPAAAGIARLNQRYGPAPGGDRFLLLHRQRVWNERRSALDRLGTQARQAA